MSEIQKHIESCRSEDPLAQTMEACGNESDIQAALQPLLVDTMQGYVPVPTTAPTSPIAELPNVLISIIRRVATKPLAILGERPAKQSLLGTLLDTWNAIRQRLSGNPSAGIPDRRADMSGHSLPTSLALLSDRKITNGGSTTDGIPDGISLAHLLGDSSVHVTKLIDDNEGWTLTRNISTIINNYFPSLAKIKLLCTKLTVNTLFDNVQTAEFEVPELRSLNNESDNHNVAVLRNCSNVEEFSAPIKVLGAGTAISNNAKLRVLRLPECDYIGGWSYDVPITNNPNLEEAYLNSYTPSANSALANPIGNCPKLWKVVFGVVRSLNTWGNASPNFVSTDCTKVRHLEIGGAIVSFSLANWTPDEDTIAHQDFLPNFKEHIALRLTANGSGKTLTLSQAVRDAIHAAEATYGIEAIIVTQKGWTLSPAPGASSQ